MLLCGIFAVFLIMTEYEFNQEPLCINKSFNRSHGSILAVAPNEQIAMDIVMRRNFARKRKDLTLTEITASFVDERLA
jgi:hypothetical protein